MFAGQLPAVAQHDIMSGVIIGIFLLLGFIFLWLFGCWISAKSTKEESSVIRLMEYLIGIPLVCISIFALICSIVFH